MKIRKFFEYFKSEATKDDMLDIFADLEDEYEVDIEIYENATDPFFPSYPNSYFDVKKRPKIGRFEAISKIIELKTGELISPKFVESYMSDYFGYQNATQQTKDYHKQFSDSKRYPKDIELIKKYDYSITFLIFLNYKYSERELVLYDYEPIFARLKSMYDLDKLYFHKNDFLGDNGLRTTIMVV